MAGNSLKGFWARMTPKKQTDPSETSMTTLRNRMRPPMRFYSSTAGDSRLAQNKPPRLLSVGRGLGVPGILVAVGLPVAVAPPCALVVRTGLGVLGDLGGGCSL